MLFHISMAAERPKQAARLIAELWQGRAYPFPPVADGSWVAMAGDDRGSAIEVYPLGTELRQGVGAAAVQPVAAARTRHGPVHIAIASELSLDEVKAIGARYGAPTKLCSRGPFELIELWLEGHFMIEVLTPEMQADYRACFTLDGWERFLAETERAEAA